MTVAPRETLGSGCQRATAARKFSDAGASCGSAWRGPIQSGRDPENRYRWSGCASSLPALSPATNASTSPTWSQSVMDPVSLAAARMGASRPMRRE